MRFVCVMVMLVGCKGDPQPCDTLCEDAGYDQIEDVVNKAGEAVCTCSGGNGLGGSITQAKCENFCSEVGEDPELARVSGDGNESSCTCMLE